MAKPDHLAPLNKRLDKSNRAVVPHFGEAMLFLKAVLSGATPYRARLLVIVFLLPVWSLAQQPETRAKAGSQVSTSNCGPSIVNRSGAITIEFNGSCIDDYIVILAQQLDNPDRVISSRAAEELSRIGPAAVPALIKDLKSSQPFQDRNFRDKVVYALGKIGPAARAAVPTLSDALKSPQAGFSGSGLEHVEFRAVSAVALGSIGSASHAAVLPALIQAMQDSNTDVREGAAIGLVTLATALQDVKEVDAIEQLQKARDALRKQGFQEQATNVGRAVDFLKLQRDTRERDTRVARFLKWAVEHPWEATASLTPPLYLVWFLFLRLVILPRAPLRVLAWNEILTASRESVEVEVPVLHFKTCIQLRPARSLLRYRCS